MAGLLELFENGIRPGGGSRKQDKVCNHGTRKAGPSANHSRRASRKELAMSSIRENGNGRQGQGSCSCSEGRCENRKSGEPLSTIHAHSCEYVRHRNSLIPSAAAFADRKVSADERGAKAWSKAFSGRMEKLMRSQEAGDEQAAR
jgi:hypothetical protein